MILESTSPRNITMKSGIALVIFAICAVGTFALPPYNQQQQTAAPAVPKFANAYHATGTIHLPYAELHEPFTIYFNSSFKASVLSFYNDLDVVYNRGDLKDGGSVFKLSPTVIKGKIIPQGCFEIKGSKDSPVLPQSVLPDLTGFQYNVAHFSTKPSSIMTTLKLFFKRAPRSFLPNGYQDLAPGVFQKLHSKYAGPALLARGVTADMWMNTTTIGSRSNKYSFYTTQSKPVKPLRYEMMGFDSLLGSHYDKYVVEYETYEEPETIPRSVFDVPAGVQCGDFPGPGVERHIVANPFQEIAHPERGDRYATLFNEYKDKHDREYADDKEHSKRQGIFTNNVRYIHSHNRKPLTYKLAINHLVDRHRDEMRATRGRLTSKGYNGGQPFDTSDIKASDVPDQMDWRLLGAVSQVKDQAICGSCWSFGAAESIEGAYFLKNNKMVRFSQQNLMDCSWDKGNNGCDGGEEWRAYQYVIDNGGLMTEEDYGAYMGQNGLCHFNASQAAVKIKTYHNITSGNQTELKQAIATKGPVAVGIDASHPSLSFYSHGVYYEPDCGNTPDDLDHAVLAVGYGIMASSNTSYWIIKNSWSTYWGNNGYVLMDWKNNNCGVATDATYVNLA